MIELKVESDWIDCDEYTNFIRVDADNATIFHSINFLAYHPQEFFKNKEKLHFKFYKKERLISSLLGVLYNENGKQVFKSPFGASYGGFLLDKAILFSEIEKVVAVWLQYLTNRGVHSVNITNPTVIHSKCKRHGYLDYVLLANGFQTAKSDLLLVHELSNQIDPILRFERKTRTEIKQPLSNTNLSLRVKSGVDKKTYNILLDSQRRLISNPTHTFEDLKKIESLLPKTITSFEVLNSGVPVAGIITFSITEEVLNTFYIFDTIESRDLKANHYSYYHVINWAQENGYKYLDFGPSSFGFIPNYHLIKFKEKFDVFPVSRLTFSKSSPLIEISK